MENMKQEVEDIEEHSRIALISYFALLSFLLLFASTQPTKKNRKGKHSVQGEWKKNSKHLANFTLTQLYFLTFSLFCENIQILPWQLWH